jgi:hypothetical protein
MGELKVNGTTYNDLVTVDSAANDGPCYLIEPIGSAPMEGAPIYEESHVTYPGVDGMGIKRFGFRGRIITVDMGFLGGTKSKCELDKNTFHTSVSGLSSFAIQLPGGTNRQYCRLQSCSPIGWRQYGLDTMMLMVRYEFLQVRENS